MNNITIKMLDPEQYYLLEEFCQIEGIPMLSPEWSKVVAAIDIESGKVVGIVVAQMQTHVEPIHIKEGYRNGRISKELVETLDGYLDTLSLISGARIGAWAQPTNSAAEKMLRRSGYEKSDKPLWTKVYDGGNLAKIVTNGYFPSNLEVTKE